MKKKKSSSAVEVKVSKELQQAFDRFPAIVKKKAQVAKEKKRIRKNFESVRSKIFGK